MLKTYFPNGKYWNHSGYSVQGLSQSQYCMITTDKKCNHIGKYSDTCNHYIGKEKAYFEYDDNYQCLAFASMISDLLYGPNAEVVKHSDFDKIKVGDHIRFVSRTHSVIVIEKTASSVKVVECNYQKSGCKIAWGRVIGKDFFKTCGTYFVLSRKEQVKKEEPKEEPKPEQKEEPKEEPKEEQKEESEEEKPQEEVSSQVTSSEEQQEEEKSES